MNNQNHLLLTLSKEDLVGEILDQRKEIESLRNELNKLSATIVALRIKLDQSNLSIHQKNKIIQELENLKKSLENRLKMHSQNSSKPPSTDGFKKPMTKSERIKTGKKSGGQIGHQGATLKPVQNPDVVKKYEIPSCQSCFHDLSDIKSSIKVRQEIIVPLQKAQVVEHQIAIKVCPECKNKNTAGPINFTQAIQYGTSVKAYALYWRYVQLIPYKRMEEMFLDLHGLAITEGTLVNMCDEIAHAIEEKNTAIHQEVLRSFVVNFDETSIKINGKIYWLHVASNQSLTSFFLHKKRGAEAMNAHGVINKMNKKGVAVHDGWKAYYVYGRMQHGLCNAHHLRELQSMVDHYKHVWAKKMKDYLLELNKIVHQAKFDNQQCLSDEQLKKIKAKYDRILKKAMKEIPDPEGFLQKRKNQKQHPAKNLIDRLVKYKDDTLRFITNFAVPFTNNQAEQDFRMMKVQQKISGGFRSLDGAELFCKVRGFISTAKKQNINVFHGLQRLI